MNENILNEGTEPVENKTKVLIGLSKSDGSKVAVTVDEYDIIDKSSFATEGIVVRNDDVDLLFSPDEVDAVMGEGPADIPETDKRRKGQSSQINGTEYDGEERTAIQLELHPEAHDDGCAVCEAVKFGWLPSYGEMTLLYKNKDVFNELAGKAEITSLSDAKYWTSTQFSDDYMWSVDFANNIAEFWRSKSSTMKVRPCKSAVDYQETINE